VSDEKEKAPDTGSEAGGEAAKGSTAEDTEAKEADARQDKAEAEEPGDGAEAKQDEAEAKQDEAEAKQDEAEAKQDEAEAKQDKADEPTRRETWTNTLIWALGILCLLGIELYVYGHDGDIEVCVGIDKLTDYAIRAEPRTKANATKHPFCAKRVNLGMWSKSDELADAALKEACGAASRVVGAEHRQKCIRRDDPWTRFVEKQQIPPWDPRLYRRILWLD
jgi:hypothetical protein